MLVLTRKQQEEIHIGNNVTITILRIKGQSVRIGINAPKDVRVIRGELEIQFNEEREMEQPQAESPCVNPPLPKVGSSKLERPRGSNKQPESSCRKLLEQPCSSELPCRQVNVLQASGKSANASTLAILARRSSRGFSAN